MNLVSKLEETASQKPEKPACLFQDQYMTYEELAGKIKAFANGLEDRGLKKGDHLALLLGNTPDFVIAFFGALKAGIVVIPVNPVYTPSEIAYMLKNGDVKAIAGIDLLIPVFESLHGSLPLLEHIIISQTAENAPSTEDPQLRLKMTTFTKMLRPAERSRTYPTLSKDDTAVILYTSGTTGKPKGAMLTHQNLFSNANDVAGYLGMNEKDKIVAALPMFHVFCLTVCMNAPLMSGACVLIEPQFSPASVFKLIKSRQATIFAGVPTMYNYLYQYEHGKAEDFTSVRLCISGGASMPVALLQTFEQTFDVTILEGYGLSEASPVTCFNPFDRGRKPGSIGTNILHVENKVVDTLGRELPDHQVGELIVKGPNVMKGYYKMPEETEHALKDGWLYTGDLAKRDEDGYFYIVDRKKDMILVGGYNVYPREVEEVLYSHEGIKEAVVIGVPDAKTGEAVHAYIVPGDGELTEQAVFDYCETHLAKYKRPAEVVFLDEIPKNATGKLLRRAVRDMLPK
ncbi:MULTISPECIES: fatty acid--CoA ligase family protein [Bacillus]|uniref:fatty acid--CoA ligase family protein n=1 Tax=Bacillus TaxID=1386 RepID=UPI0006ADACDC|nr:MULTISPECIES: fatty acid--CoA ligase family protein [Bacillus]AWD86944.1 long-chain fatty acid--CoA ligase [Bacillus velezensis]AWM51108.1 fatty acid--CoA ligase family protein [Bacillus amyloliquefaciens]KAF6693799.1 fatty acid--CoA ligase family protein [Bacillus sp. EKM601B]KOS51262.1 long-chain fatty acid--CoA ligase [Bacillus amyloliquefaciens]MBA9147401.1 fatty acid--CoA ligase family protein [Bacillus sp. EKM213B]